MHCNNIIDRHFSDITLISDDLVPTEAHRVILSASSPLLKSLLMMSPRGHTPLFRGPTQLFLKGIKHVQLEAVLKFIYYGEVQVTSGEVRKFLEAGEELQISELMDIVKNREDEEGENDETVSDWDVKVETGVFIEREKDETVTDWVGTGDVIERETEQADIGVSRTFNNPIIKKPLEVFKHFVYQKEVSPIHRYSIYFR